MDNVCAWFGQEWNKNDYISGSSAWILIPRLFNHESDNVIGLHAKSVPTLVSMRRETVRIAMRFYMK